MSWVKIMLAVAAGVLIGEFLAQTAVILASPLIRFLGYIIWM